MSECEPKPKRYLISVLLGFVVTLSLTVYSWSATSVRDEQFNGYLLAWAAGLLGLQSVIFRVRPAYAPLIGAIFGVVVAPLGLYLAMGSQVSAILLLTQMVTGLFGVVIYFIAGAAFGVVVGFLFGRRLNKG